jgi:hypothetical protein
MASSGTDSRYSWVMIMLVISSYFDKYMVLLPGLFCKHTFRGFCLLVQQLDASHCSLFGKGRRASMDTFRVATAPLKYDMVLTTCSRVETI